LYYQVDIWDVKTSRSDVSGDQNLEFSFFEALHSDFTLILGDVSMHYLDVLFDFIRQNQTVRVGLGLREYNGFANSTVAYQHVSEG